MKLAMLLCFIALTTHAEELWKGTLYLNDGTQLKGSIENVTADAVRIISAGTAYHIKIARLHPVSVGELGIGTAADKAAYQADLPRRQAQAALAAATARDRAASAARLAERDRTYEQEQRNRKQAEMRAFQARENERRKTEALEQIALELQIRRLQGK